MFPVMPVPLPLTLGSCEIKGVHGGHVLRRDERRVTLAMSAMASLLHGPIFCLPHIPLLSTSAVFLSQKRLRGLPLKVPQQSSQGLELGCGETAVRWNQLSVERRLEPGLAKA